jgi:beta-N-acetylhexosaminidase
MEIRSQTSRATTSQARCWLVPMTIVVGLAVSSCGTSPNPPASVSAPTPGRSLAPSPSPATPTTTAPATTPPSTAPSAVTTGALPRPVKPATKPARSSDAAIRALARMSLEQRVGQLIMVGAKATDPPASTSAAISSHHVGNVILSGRSSLGTVATSRVSARLRARATKGATAGVGLFVAADQEGGQVQVFRGAGFSTIPDALTQGGWATSRLRASAATWGNELRSAGVNVNLAPVADTVPRAMAGSNRPIGFYQREFGFTTAVVGEHASAFVRGMRASGVAATPKHFPGLGRVTSNTDTTAGVTDSTTTRHDTYLGPFRQAIAAGAPFVMMSSATYSRIDPRNPACFSPTIITGMLRGDLGFRGVVISDDLGASKQVSRWSPGSRATKFVSAGGDMVLTVDPALAPAMAQALVAKASTSAFFRQQVDAAALRVLRAKASAGLLPLS